MSMIELEQVCDCGAHIAGPQNQPKERQSHGICMPCLKKKSPGAYYMSRRREVATKLENFDRLPGSKDMDGYFWSRRAA